ncbi:MAG: hypothetical protein O7G85_02985 [Planctomycetota bacterium]|nr:hypothetical protein [Planctomycetota bacterium]
MFAMLSAGMMISPTTGDEPSENTLDVKVFFTDGPVAKPEGNSYTQDSDEEEDFTFDTGGDDQASNFLTENLRVGIDLLTRFETTRERDQNGWLHAFGLDIHKVISDDQGDIGTLLLQPYAVRRDSLPLPNHVDEDHRWEFEAHDFYFNLTRFGQGRTNIRIGHFDVPYGLEPYVDTHFTLRQFAPMQNIGTKKDWGISLNGTLPDFDYEVALTRGSGVEYVDKSHNYVVAGRIGTPADENFVIGFSAMYAEIIDPMHVMRYRMGLPMSEMMMFNPKHDIIRRHRFGVDVTSVQGQFTLRGECSVGEDFDQDVILALVDIEWTNPDGTWKAWLQGFYWAQDGTTGWDADVTMRTGVNWNFASPWTLSAQLTHDFESYLNRVDDTIFTAQLRRTF